MPDMNVSSNLLWLMEGLEHLLVDKEMAPGMKHKPTFERLILCEDVVTA